MNTAVTISSIVLAVYFVALMSFAIYKKIKQRKKEKEIKKQLEEEKKKELYEEKK